MISPQTLRFVEPVRLKHNVRGQEGKISRDDDNLVRCDPRRWGAKKSVHNARHCHHHNDFGIKMGSDESRFNVSLIGEGRGWAEVGGGAQCHN